MYYLVIDMQKAMFATPRLNKDKVVSNIRLLSENVRANDGLVIFIQHNRLKRGVF